MFYIWAKSMGMPQVHVGLLLSVYGAHVMVENGSNGSKVLC